MKRRAVTAAATFPFVSLTLQPVVIQLRACPFRRSAAPSDGLEQHDSFTVTDVCVTLQGMSLNESDIPLHVSNLSFTESAHQFPTASLPDQWQSGTEHWARAKMTSEQFGRARDITAYVSPRVRHPPSCL